MRQISLALLLLLAITALTIHQPAYASSAEHKVLKYDRDKNCATDQHTRLTIATYLTHFSCGHVDVLKNGTTLRQFSLVISENVKVPITLGNKDTHTPPIMYDAWTFNGSIPAPTIRVTQGDHVSIKVINLPDNKFPHSLHMHSIHGGAIDGTMFNNASGTIAPGHAFTYNFTADPVGLWPFHCHMMPISMHIVHGLYGHMIIDPPANEARPHMTEMNMIMNGYDLTLQPNSDQLRMPTVGEANAMMQGGEDGQNVSESLPQEHDNQIYSLNGVAFYYDVYPIPLQVGQAYRVYLTNMLDFDFSNTFHIHGTVFQYYPSATSRAPEMTTDIVSLPQGDRGIMEFKFAFPGLFLMHSHFESQAARGWEGLLKVTGEEHDHKLMSMDTILTK